MRNILFGSNVTAAVAPSNGQNATESFHVTLTPAQRATFLQGAKNMRLAPKTCDQLTQQIVQDVISRFADGTKTHAQRILRGETTTAEQNKTATTSTPGAVASSDPVAPVNLDAAEAATNGAAAAAASSDPVDVVLVNSDVAEAASNGAATAAASSDAVDAAEPATNGAAAAVAPVPAAPLKAWNLLKPRERSRRCFQAARLFKPFWALFVAALGAVDDDGLPLSNNALFAIFLQYGVLDAFKSNRLAPGLSFPECLPDAAVAKIKNQGRANHEKEQRRYCYEECRDEWVSVKSWMTQDTWNTLRRLLPPQVMPSWYWADKEQKENRRRYGNTIRFLRTHTGFQADLRAMLPLLFMSNLLKFVAIPGAKLADKVYILSKLMIDGANVQFLSAGNLINAHINCVFLPLDPKVMMTDLLLTDEDHRANNPACKEGICSGTVGVCLGSENFGNVKINFTSKVSDPCGSLLDADLKKLTVPKLLEQCEFFGVKKSKLKEDLIASLELFIARHRERLQSEATASVADLDEDCWYEFMPRVAPGDDMFSVLRDYEGAEYVAYLPIFEEDGTWARDLDSRVRYRIVIGRLGHIYSIDMKM